MNDVVYPGLDVSLPDFHRQIESELKSQQASSEAFLAFQVQDEKWLVDLDVCRETSVLPHIAKTGKAPPHVIGVGSFRGQILTVIDMMYWLKKEKLTLLGSAWTTPLDPKTGSALALAWPMMIGLVSTQRLKNRFETDRAWSKGVWKDEEGELWYELDMSAIMASEELGTSA